MNYDIFYEIVKHLDDETCTSLIFVNKKIKEIVSVYVGRIFNCTLKQQIIYKKIMEKLSTCMYKFVPECSMDMNFINFLLTTKNVQYNKDNKILSLRGNNGELFEHPHKMSGYVYNFGETNYVANSKETFFSKDDFWSSWKKPIIIDRELSEEEIKLITNNVKRSINEIWFTKKYIQINITKITHFIQCGDVPHNIETYWPSNFVRLGMNVR